MPFCSECGKEYQDSANFCPHCGTPNSLSVGSNSAKIVRNGSNTILDSAFQTVKRNSISSYGAYRLEDLQEGFVIDDRYIIKKKLGQGGFGTVYLVNDRTLNTQKALKVFPDALGNDPEALKDLQKEAQTLMQLTHDSIVRVYDLHLTGSIKYLDMEYVEGKPLNELKLEYEDKKVPEDLVIEIAKKVINGLSYAHQNNIIHKDIKPHNIMLMEDGSIKIMDFGIAENIRSSMSKIANSSSSGTLVYMSPEQVKGEDIGPESDIYSFGAMLYELLSGHPPFYKGDIHYQIFNEKPEYLKGVSSESNEIIRKCLEKDYKKRYKSFVVLQEFLEGGGDSAIKLTDTFQLLEAYKVTIFSVFVCDYVLKRKGQISDSHNIEEIFSNMALARNQYDHYTQNFIPILEEMCSYKKLPKHSLTCSETEYAEIFNSKYISQKSLLEGMMSYVTVKFNKYMISELPESDFMRRKEAEEEIKRASIIYYDLTAKNEKILDMIEFANIHVNPENYLGKIEERPFYDFTKINGKSIFQAEVQKELAHQSSRTNLDRDSIRRDLSPTSRRDEGGYDMQDIKVASIILFSIAFVVIIILIIT